MKKKPTNQSIAVHLLKALHLFRLYAGVLFFLLCAGAYGVVILKINSLSNVQVDPSAVTEQVQATPSPHIDPKVVQQLEALKDNSVNVQTLFEQNRTNPFQE